MNLKRYSFALDRHRDQNVILVQFSFDKRLQEALRTRFPSAKWSRTKKAWYLPEFTQQVLSQGQGHDLNECAKRNEKSNL